MEFLYLKGGEVVSETIGSVSASSVVLETPKPPFKNKKAYINDVCEEFFARFEEFYDTELKPSLDTLKFCTTGAYEKVTARRIFKRSIEYGVTDEFDVYIRAVQNHRFSRMDVLNALVHETFHLFVNKKYGGSSKAQQTLSLPLEETIATYLALNIQPGDPYPIDTYYNAANAIRHIQLRENKSPRDMLEDILDGIEKSERKPVTLPEFNHLVDAVIVADTLDFMGAVNNLVKRKDEEGKKLFKRYKRHLSNPLPLAQRFALLAQIAQSKQQSL